MLIPLMALHRYLHTILLHMVQRRVPHFLETTLTAAHINQAPMTTLPTHKTHMLRRETMTLGTLKM